MGYSALARVVITNGNLARLAKPRGGRRPGALRPPAAPSAGMPAQQNLNSFGEGDRISMNGTQQQQGGFSFGQQLNGNQPNQNSSSFPPYPSNSFNPSFAAPTSGFNFNAGQAQDVNNPFTAINTHNAPPPEPTGFQGSIFNIPPQKMSPFQKYLEGEQKPQFAPGAPEITASNLSQPSSNPFSQSTDQPSQAAPGIFSQPNAQQQQPTTIGFGQSTVGTSQTQSSSNPFAQSIAHFQQSQSAQPTPGLFAHLGQPLPSSNFLTQSSTSPTQGESSMMQTSPDPSPQSRPFGFLSQPNPETSPTKGSTAQGGGGSLFDRISKPSETTSQSQSSLTKDSIAQGSGASLFDRISKPPVETISQSQPSPTKDSTAQDSGSNLFNRISKPSAETNPPTFFNPTQDSSTINSTSPFSMPQPPGTSQTSNENRASSPTKISERKIAKPTLYQAPSEESRPSFKGLFSNLKMPPTSQSSPSFTTSGVSAIPQSSLSQPKNDSVLPTAGNSGIPSSSMSTQQFNQQAENHRKFGPPSAPEGYNDEEVRKWSQDWWISFYVRHKEKRMRNAERQCDERIKAVQNGFDPLAQIAGNKRKPITEHREGGENGIHEKRSRVEDAPIFSIQQASGASANGIGLQPPSKRDTQVQQTTNKNNKRSADEEPERDNAHGIADNGKKARGDDAVTYPSLSAASPGSQTSSIFKNILDKKEEAKVNGTENTKATPLFQFPVPSGPSSNQSPNFKPSSNTFSPQPSTDSPPKSSFASFTPASNSFQFANQQNSSNGALPSTSTPSFKPTGSAATPSTASNPGPFSFKPPTSSEAPSDATKALAVKFSSGATTSTESSATPFSAKPTSSGQTSSEEPKASAFKVPTFGAAVTSNTSNASPFSIKPSTSGQTSSEEPKAPVFQVPKFGTGASSTNFMSQFGKAAEKTAAEEKKKRKAEDFDSDEEDLEAWEARDAAEQAKKKNKLEEEIKGKAAKLIDGKWVIAADNETSSTTTKQTEPADPNVSVLSQPRALLTNGHNIFGHLSGEESGAEGSKTGDADADDEEDEDEQDDETNEQNKVRGPFVDDDSENEQDNNKDTKTNQPKAVNNPFGATANGADRSPSRYDHDAPEEGNEENTGRSLFDRISKDKDGKPIREIPQPDSQPVSQTSNVFGQSFKSSSSSNLFSQPSDTASSFTSVNSKPGDSPKGDHTWKADSPIKFGNSSNPPSVNVTSPSPSKPTFGGIFGASKPNAAAEASMKATSSVFSTPPAKTPSVGFSFGLKPTTASLALPSNNGSNTTSRATSPGATTGESANESNADGEDDKAEKHEQIDLTSPGPGEENEDVVLQVKAKALKWDTAKSTWASKGVGPLRVLKNRESHLTRVLLRQDPSGRIVLNFGLSKSFTYESSQSKTVRVPFLGESGKIETWMIKVGNDDDAKKLANALEENKA